MIPDYPLEILYGRATQSGIQNSRDFGIFNLPFGEVQLVLGDGINKRKLCVVFLAQIVVPRLAHLALALQLQSHFVELQAPWVLLPLILHQLPTATFLLQLFERLRRFIYCS